MTMLEAMTDGLNLMHDVLGARRKVDERMVGGYLDVIQDDGLKPEDVELACRWFSKDGDGNFPTGPVFRRRCQVERSRREARVRDAIYQSRLEAMDDPFADESDTLTQEQARALLKEALTRLDGKYKDNPLTRRPKTSKEVREDIRRMRAA